MSALFSFNSIIESSVHKYEDDLQGKYEQDEHCNNKDDFEDYVADVRKLKIIPNDF
jgi:hypothetical protein